MTTPNELASSNPSQALVPISETPAALALPDMVRRAGAAYIVLGYAPRS